MERSLTTEATATSAPAGLAVPLHLGRRLLPLWRHAVFLAALFGVAVAGAMVRLEVQQLRKDLDRTSKAILDARVLNDRLTLEHEARARVVAVEATATAMGLTGAARLDTVVKP
ncbi:MAG: hypothetical protein H6737_32095 [Alphaproteobacteria bacterium]|nr:hypothetical protein [Alphaproteobacteria bacterium]